MTTLWKKSQDLDPRFETLNRCLDQDWFLLPFELRLQEAHAAALQACGILSEREQADLRRALQQIAAERRGTAVPPAAEHGGAEDLHTWVEQELTRLAGEAGRKIHTARSRNDQVATLLKMFVLEAGGAFSRRLAALAELFCRRAAEWSELVFPLQTHSQFAAPGTVGFWALRYAAAFERSHRHVEACLGLWRRHCPLGSGAVAGSSIPVDRDLQARLLGFDGPSFNALDATSTRDECLEFLALAATCGLHLQSLATDVILFAQTSLGWVLYPPQFGTGSSMMPNKFNPDAMELLRGEACALAAAHGQAVLLLKGLPSGYNRDLQCIKPLVRETAERLGTLLDLTASFVRQLAFEPRRLRASTAMGHLCATLHMEQRVREGMALREAHHSVAEALHGLPAAESAGEPQPRVLDDIDAAVAAYATAGSASPAETRRMAEQIRRGLVDHGAAARSATPGAGYRG